MTTSLATGQEVRRIPAADLAQDSTEKTPALEALVPPFRRRSRSARAVVTARLRRRPQPTRLSGRAEYLPSISWFWISELQHSAGFVPEPQDGDANTNGRPSQEENRLRRLVALLWRTLFRKIPLIMIPRPRPQLALAAAICLSSLTLSSKILADDISNAVDAFDRDLGLERMGSDIVNVDPQSSAAESSNSEATQKNSGHRRDSRLSHPPLSPDILTFRSSQRVTDSLRGFMIAKVTQNDMTAIPAVEKRFANDVLLHRFNRMFSSYGFSSHNLGDTVAGYLIASWEIINDADAAGNIQGIRRVREAVHNKMKEKRKVIALSDTDKQRYSEIFKYFTVLMIDKMNELKQKHNDAGQRQLREQAAQPPLKIGLDLRRMRFTGQGFVQ
jgi:hypothetical protein